MNALPLSTRSSRLVSKPKALSHSRVIGILRRFDLLVRRHVNLVFAFDSPLEVPDRTTEGVTELRQAACTHDEHEHEKYDQQFLTT